MCKAMEEMRMEAAMEATIRERKRFAISLWKDGIQDVVRIAHLTNMTTEMVQDTLGIKTQVLPT